MDADRRLTAADPAIRSEPRQALTMPPWMKHFVHQRDIEQQLQQCQRNDGS
jgi:hypothetical protein